MLDFKVYKYYNLYILQWKESDIMAKKQKVDKKKKDVKKELKEEVLDDIKAEEKDEEVVEEKVAKPSKKKIKLNKKRCFILGGILLVLICVVLGIVLYKQGVHEFPIIYKGKDNNLYLLRDGDKPSEAVVFSNRDGIGYISFFNDNPRYFLYKKSVDLYIYDVKKFKEKKIISDYTASFVTNDDQYVVALDKLNTLYSYKVNGDVVELGLNVDGDVAFTDDYVLFESYEGAENVLYISYLNGKKTNVKVDSDVVSYQFSEDGTKVVYISKDNDLIIYNIKNGKSDKVNSDVKDFYCDSDECDDLYYVLEDNSILYYNGKKSTVYVKESSDLISVDCDANLLLYSTNSGDNLYLKNGKSDSVLIDDNFGRNGYAKIREAEDIYYVNSNKELKYYNIKNDKKKELLKNVSGVIINSKNGYYFFTDLNAVGSGILYYVVGDKATKVNDDVYSFNYYVVNKKGDKLYYYSKYGDKTGSLYVFDGKDNTLISDKVYQYQYINDNLIYYLADYDLVNINGNLYKYEKGEKTAIAERVQSLVQSRINQYRK